MKDWQYHLINSAIAGSLVTLGSLSSLFTGYSNLQSFFLGLGLGVITGIIVFLNKMQEWITTQDPDKPTNLNILNFM